MSSCLVFLFFRTAQLAPALPTLTIPGDCLEIGRLRKHASRWQVWARGAPENHSRAQVSRLSSLTHSCKTPETQHSSEATSVPQQLKLHSEINYSDVAAPWVRIAADFLSSDQVLAWLSRWQI
jgi:hypothetical protein